MPIHVPGRRDRHHRTKKPGKRKVVAVLQLTAMVDMFTVMVVFLLQNYATTGEVISIPKEVRLPTAHEVKELKPSNVIVVSSEGVLLNSVRLAGFREVKEQEDWMITNLRNGIERMIMTAENNEKTLGNRLKEAVSQARGNEPNADETPRYRKITIQADKEIDFLTVKKVMFTATEAGIAEINFAVIKRPDKGNKN